MPDAKRTLCALLAAISWIAACNDDTTRTITAVEKSAVLVVAADEGDALRDRLVATSGDYLERITGVRPAVHRLPAGASMAEILDRAERASAGLVVVLDAEMLAPERVRRGEVVSLANGGFRVLVTDEGDFPNSLVGDDRGATVVLLAGDGKLARQYAVYELLRRLGVRFFHPEEEWVPRLPLHQVRQRAATATALARTSGAGVSNDYTPDFRFRGFTFHGAHPLEHLEAFSDGDFPIDEAERALEWILKNRGESFRGAGRGVSSAESRARRVAELEELRVLFGMSHSTGITLHNVQQGGRPQIDPSSPIPVREQIETLVEERLAARPDATQLGIHFGPTEVSVTPDVETVQWIDWAGQKSLELRPDVAVIITLLRTEWTVLNQSRTYTSTSSLVAGVPSNS